MSNSAAHGWMCDTLSFLFDELTDAEARAAIGSEAALHQVRQRVFTALAQTGEGQRIPAGDRGDNLLLALLALRTKFDRSVAFEKLEVNIAMRTGRDPRPTGGDSR